MAMKTYSIGRDANCDIVINDATDVVSRRHALLNVSPSGKMTIIDQSSNGTYVNGIRISPNVSVPVTRKDVVSLAHVAKLDWGLVPKNTLWFRITLLTGIAVVIAICTVIVVKFLHDNSPYGDENNPTVIEQVDSTEIKQKEAARIDSLRKIEHEDSIKKKKEERRDSIRSVRKNEAKIKENNGEREEKDKKETSKDSIGKRTTVVV